MTQDGPDVVQPGHDEVRGAAVVQRGRSAALHLAIRAVAVRGIALVGMVALAHILRPAEFGLFALVSFFVGLLALVGDVGIGAALVRQQQEPTRAELATAWSLQQVMWLSLMGLIWLAAPLVLHVAPDLPPETPLMIQVLSLTLLFMSLRALPAAMMARVLHFGPLASIEVAQHVLFNVAAVALALAGLGAWSFILAAVAQAALGALLVNVAWRRWPGVGFDRHIARRLFRFGALYQLANVVLWARMAVVPLFGGLAGGLGAVGYLHFAWRNGQVVATVDEIMGRVGLPAYSRLQDDPERLERVVRRAVETTALLVAMVQCWVIAVAPTLVPVVFSEKWIPAVPALQLVCLGTLAMVPVQILRPVVFARGDIGQGLRLTTAAVALLFVAFPVLVLAFGIAGGGLAFALSAAGSLVLHQRATATAIAFPYAGMLRIYALGALAGVTSMAALELVSRDLVGLAASGLVFLAVYGALLAILERDPIARLWLLLRGRAAAQST